MRRRLIPTGSNLVVLLQGAQKRPSRENVRMIFKKIRK